MKKIFTLFAAAFMAAGMYAGNFGMKVNDTYYPGTLNPTPGDPSFTEYMVLDISVEANATLQLWDADNNVGWAIDLDNASVAGIHRDGNHYTCTVAGCYSFYIKIKENNDQLYIGSGSCEGGGQGGGDNPGGQGGETPNAYWYWKGQVDGGPIENEAGGYNIFVGGISSIAVDEAAYIFVIYQEKGVQGIQYMTDGWKGMEITHVTMGACGDCPNGNKLYIPAGDYTLYLYDNGDGTVELSREELAGKTLVGGGEQAIEHTKVTEKAYKQIINGQLRIIRGDKMYDATGKEL